jgi:hypothetical protein
MLASIFSSGYAPLGYALTALLALIGGLAYSAIIGFKLRSSKGFFLTASLMPLVVAAVIAFMGGFLSDASSTTARIVTIAVALGLIRFRSAPGRSEEMLVLFGSVAIGLVYGLGYLAYASIAAIAFALLFIGIASLPVFTHAKFQSDKTLKVTIPESLEYREAFVDIFAKYLKENELVGVKTTGMGSLYRLTYRIKMKNESEEKAFIDDLKTKNANLEISILPYEVPQQF